MSISHIITPLATGFLFSLSLIVAIGPQTAFVRRQGVRRTHAGIVVAFCAASDAILITAGVAGLGKALSGRPWLLDATRAFGATLLAARGLLPRAGRRARVAVAAATKRRSARPRPRSPPASASRG